MYVAGAAHELAAYVMALANEQAHTPFDACTLALTSL